MSVELNADDAPTKVMAVKKQLRPSDGQEPTAAVVETILEMWRIDDEWWRKLISRRYFAVILEEGTRVVLFEDLVTHEWFMQTP